MDFPILYISSVSDGHVGLLAKDNRHKYFKKLGITEKQVVSMHLTHSINIVRVTSMDGGKLFENTDALITDSKDIYLALPVGDCLPVALYDPKTQSAGLVHAGWRGLNAGIIQKTIQNMVEEFGTNPQGIRVFIGAHICQKHFEVKSDVSGLFDSYKGVLKKVGGKQFLDLGKIATNQLLEAGVLKKNISLSDICNYEDPAFFSYRRGDKISRNLYLLTLSQ